MRYLSYIAFLFIFTSRAFGDGFGLFTAVSLFTPNELVLAGCLFYFKLRALGVAVVAP